MAFTAFAGRRKARTTYWQARWDASGWRNSVGTAQAEMWVAFGLPGQILLAKHIVGGSVDFENGLITAEQWGSEAYASGTGGTWTRPPIALNQWRAYDPLFGGFLQPDGADVQGRLVPEAYAYGRDNPVIAFDRSGRQSVWFPGLKFDEWCDVWDVTALAAAAKLAYEIISKCHKGYCGGNGTGKRKWLNALSSGISYCNKFADDHQRMLTDDGVSDLGGKYSFAHTMNGGRRTSYYPRIIASFYNPMEGPECLAKAIAHERLHAVDYFTVDFSDYMAIPPFRIQLDDDMEERFTKEATDDDFKGCFHCKFVGDYSFHLKLGEETGLFH